MTLGRVLLLEDDAPIRRFVRLALDRLPLVVVEASTLRDARLALASQEPQLIIADLTLPDGSGLDLVGELRLTPAGLRTPRVLIFSAGISVPVRRHAEGLGVWGLLDKPASVTALVDSVRRGLDLEGPVPGKRPHGQASALRDRFNGRADLFDAFVSATVAGFPDDIARGDAAWAQRDIPSLRRVAHNLKSVLQLLGANELSAVARCLEVAADPSLPDHDELNVRWQQLRVGLRALG